MFNYNPDHNQYISLNNIESYSNDGESKECKKSYKITYYLFIFLTIMLLFSVGIYLFTLYIHK